MRVGIEIIHVLKRSESLIILLTSYTCIVGVVELLSCVLLFGTPHTVGPQAPLTVGLYRQEFWSGLPFPAPQNLPTPGIKPASAALAGGFYTQVCHWEV